MGDDDDNQGHGQKRRAADELERDQRLTKRFDLLNLTNDSKLYVPVSAAAKSSSAIPRPGVSNNEPMEIEDTKDKVYIYDLDKELAESESDDERPIFIPDIERHLLARIPRHVLIGDDAREAAKNMQMIIYQAPNSLSVSADKDNVRRAIIESRKRAQDRQAFTIPAAPTKLPNDTDGYLQTLPNTNGAGSTIEMEEDDTEAMDMD